MADEALVAPSQNDFIDSLNKFTTSITGLGQGAANIYSTFMGAKTAAALANSQKTGYALQPTASELNAINAQRAQVTNLITYGAVGIALIGTAFLVYKAWK